jgi:hypothetical protein
MKKLMTIFLLSAFVPAAFAVNEEENQVKNSGQIRDSIFA